jgi:xylose isomerase
MTPVFDPSPADRFTFGLWTVGHRGRDPFGDPTRSVLAPTEAVRRLGAIGAYGVNLHDDDLVPVDASPSDRDRLVREFRRAVADAGLCVPMATTNLFTDPVFRDGAFTAHDPDVRAYALQKTMRAIDLGVELGARLYVFWGGREGAEVDAAKDPVEALKRVREALNFLCGYVLDRKYDLRFALEAKPNEPRGDLYFATTASYLAFIGTLDHPDMVGVNPEVAHEHMAGLNFVHQVAAALEAKKLFHIDLNDQEFGRFDQDYRFGSANLKHAFFLVKLLEDHKYSGPRHFDAHAYRQSDYDDVEQFARGCMRTYMILKEKVRRWHADSEIQQIVKQINVQDKSVGALTKVYSPANVKKLNAVRFDRHRLAAEPLPYERLDQLTMELIMGVR